MDVLSFGIVYFVLIFLYTHFGIVQDFDSPNGEQFFVIFH